VPEADRSALFAELLALELELRRSRGERPTQKEYRDRFAERSRSIDAAFDVTNEGSGPGVANLNGETPNDSEAIRAARQSAANQGTTFATHFNGPSTSVARSAGVIFEIDDYELLEEIARGGMGVVYKARQKSLCRLVAIKMILTGRFASPAELQRFRNEAKAAALVDHPQIVPIYQVGEHEGRPYLCMKLIQGGSLAQQLNGTPMPISQAVLLVESLARTIHFAHQRGLIHRDLKPANVLRSPDGSYLIADFGLAKLLDGSEGLTQSDNIMGTPSYMAPEQAWGRHRDITPTADVYSLGAILYEMLTGRPPFRAATVAETLELVRSEEPAPPRLVNAKIAPDLQTICLKCLEKEPGDRYATAEALAEDLCRFQAREPIRARRTGAGERALKWAKRHPSAAALLAVSALAALALLGLVEGLWYNSRLHVALETAGTERVEADRQRKHAEELESNIRYERDVKLAQQAWQEAHVDQVLGLLDLWRPAGAGQPDLRGWEWYYLRGLGHQGFRTLAVPPAEGVRAMAFHPDSRRLATAGYGGTISVWDIVDGSLVKSLKGHTAWLHDLAFSPDGRSLASASEDKTVILWDLTSEQATARLAGAGCVRGVAYSADGRHLAAARDDGTITVWDVAGGRELHKLSGHSAGALGVAFSPDGRLLASCGQDGTARLWNTAQGTALRTLVGHSQLVSSVAFSPDGETLATSGADRTIKLWDPATGRERATLTGHTAWATRVAFSPDGRRLVSVSDDITVRLWDMATAHEVRNLRGQTESYIRSLALSPNGRWFASGTINGQVKVWDATSGPQEYRLLSPGHHDRIRAVAFAPDGRLASGGKDGTVRLWNATTGRLSQTLYGHGQEVCAVAFSIDNTLLASGDLDGTVKLWRPRTGELVRTLSGHGAEAALAFSPDLRTLAAVGQDGRVMIWNVARGEQIRLLGGPKDGVKCVAFSPDGSRLAAAGNDRTVRLWDTATWHEALTFDVHADAVSSVAFSPDGRVVASAALRDGRGVLLWKADDGTVLHELKGHWGMVQSVAFSPDGRRLATAGEDRKVKIWDTASGHEVLTLSGHTDMIYSVAFSPDGRRLASAGAGTANGPEMIRLWEAPDEQTPDAEVRPAPPSPEDLLIWHLGEVEESLDAGQRFAARWHQERLGDVALEDAMLYFRLGNVYAEFGIWDKAAVDYGNATRIGPIRFAVWRRYALACLKAGNRARYGQACLAMVESLCKAPTNSEGGRLAAWMCVVGPAAVTDYAQPLAWTECSLA